MTHHSNDQFFFEVRQSQGIGANISGSTVDTDLHYIVGTWRANEFVRLYVDGVQVAEDTTGIPGFLWNQSNLDVVIGSQASPFANFYNGKMFALIMRDVALSSTEIRMQYRIPLAPFILRKPFVGLSPVTAAGQPIAAFLKRRQESPHVLL